jgi:hypothetical protein
MFGIQQSRAARRLFAAVGLIVSLGVAGCGEAARESGGELASDLPYATRVEQISLGAGSGWGEEHLPQVVLGPPQGARSEAAVTGRDAVLSLGAGGEVALSFDGSIVDGPGADFVVFENPFWVRNDPEQVWYELAEVSVSSDGESWHTFECAVEPAAPGRWPGCAGWVPTKVYDPASVVPIDPAFTGGNAFDLADLGVESARFVRIRDLLDAGNSEIENVGFDLDAVGVVHLSGPE